MSLPIIAVIMGGAGLALTLSAVRSAVIALIVSLALLAAGSPLMWVAGDWYIEDGSPWFFIAAVMVLGGALGARHAAYRLEDQS